MRTRARSRVGSPPWQPALRPQRILRAPPRCTSKQRRSGRERSSSFRACTRIGLRDSPWHQRRAPVDRVLHDFLQGCPRELSLPRTIRGRSQQRCLTVRVPEAFLALLGEIDGARSRPPARRSTAARARTLTPTCSARSAASAATLALLIIAEIGHTPASPTPATCAPGRSSRPPNTPHIDLLDVDARPSLAQGSGQPPGRYRPALPRGVGSRPRDHLPAG